MAKKIRLFNSKFEICPRILLVLNSSPGSEFTEDRIFSLDFICVYSHEFGLTADNLHGDNAFKFSEVTARMQMIHEGIRQLVLDGLAEVSVDNGFRFTVSDTGRRYISEFESTYAQVYSERLKYVNERYLENSDADLLKMIEEKASTTGE